MDLLKLKLYNKQYEEELAKREQNRRLQVVGHSAWLAFDSTHTAHDAV